MSLSAVPIVCAAVMYGAAVAALMAATAFVVEDVRRRYPTREDRFQHRRVRVDGRCSRARGTCSSAKRRRRDGRGCPGGGSRVPHEHRPRGVDDRAGADPGLRHGDRLVHHEDRDAVPFALSLSIVPLFIVVWTTHPYVALTAVVPLAAVVLHLRSLEASRQATALSLTDPLTGLGNRRQLSERLQRELDRSDSSREPLSVCMLDVDDFKAINDSRGHAAGDDALVAVAGALRQGGEAFRLGGDEFVLLLPDHDTAARRGRCTRRDRARPCPRRRDHRRHGDV